MNCREARTLLEPLIDDVLGPEEVARLEEHLESCPACRDEHRDLSATLEVVRGIPGPAAPGGFAEEVFARLPARRSGGGRLLRLAPFAAVASLLLAAVLVANRVEQAPEGAEVTDVASGSRQKVMRRPAMEAPDDSPGAEGLVAGRGGGASAPAAPRRDGYDEKDGDRPGVDRHYVLSGVPPDAAAGQIWAELVHLRRVKARRAEKSAESEKESIESDADGEPSRMMLSVTETEMDLIAALFKQRPGALLERTNGVRHLDGAPEEAAADRAKRVRVEILLRK